MGYFYLRREKAMKKIFVVLAAILLLAIMACSGKGDNGTAGSNGNSTVTVQGNLAVLSGDDATKYKVFNSNQSSTPSSSGSFSISVAKDIPTYTYAISNDGKKVYVAVRTSADGSNITINAQSTAEAMVLLNPLLIPRTSDERIKIINIVRADAAVKTLATVIESVYGSVDDPMSDSRISDALTNAVKSVLTSWQSSSISTATALQQTVRKSSVLAYTVIRAASGSSSIQIYPTSSGVDMGALTLANSSGSNLKLELNNVGPGGITTNVDWVVRIVELDPTKIQWTNSGVPILPTDINIDSLIKTGGYDQPTIIEGAVGSGLLSFIVDPIGKVATSFGAIVFPDNGINLPNDGVYAVIALSGSPFGDSAEYNSVMNSAWQTSLWAEAASINIGAAAIDIIGVSTSFLNAATGVNIDISPLLEVELGAIKAEITANPSYIGKAYFVGKTIYICDKLLDNLKPYIHSSISDLESSGLKKFFHIAINTVTSVVDVWSGTISASSRVLNYLYSVTPRESGYAVLGTFSGQAPSTPTDFSVTAVSSSQINLAWTASTGTVTGYKVYKEGTYLKSVTTTSTSDTGLSASTNYCYYVTAYNAAGESVQTSQLCDTTQSVTYTYSISGRVTLNGSGLSGVTITLTGSGSTSTTTDSSGNYSFSSAANGSYTVTPTMTGYTFTPANRTANVSGANVTVPDFVATAVPALFSQQGQKLVGSGAVGNAQQGWSVSLSADGNTAIVGGLGDNGSVGDGVGAAWVWTRSGGVWTQQGPKLVGSGAAGNAGQGYSVSLSADGNTAIVGGEGDNGSVGAAWVWTRSGGVWTQQGTKLVGSGAAGSAYQGNSVAISADGNTAIVGGLGDNGYAGAAWVWTRSGGVWTQQGSKLVGSDAVGSQAEQGYSVSLSADGNTAIVGGISDNYPAGAAWVWTRSGGVWTQQGSKLVGSGVVVNGQQGWSVSLSADGNTAIVGGPSAGATGAAWVWTRSGGVWTQQGTKLAGSGAMGDPNQGYSVSLSANGNTAIVGGPYDNNNNGGPGAAWVWMRSGGVWTQQGSKLVGSGAVGGALQGYSMSLSGDGNTAIVGGPNDSSKAGAAWVFSQQ
jgi:hypothetical protein